MVLVNLPNSISMSRIFAVPVLILLLSTNIFSGTHGEKEIAAVAVFLLASISDGVDGYLARRRGQITTMGMLLDPLADKLMIAAAFITLVQFNPRIVPAWVAVIVVGREFLVSGLRSIAAAQGFTIEASDLGKFKMVIQIITVCVAILDHSFRSVLLPGNVVFPMELIAHIAVWFMVAVSFISATDYFVGFWSKIDKRVQNRRRTFVLSRRKKQTPAQGRAIPGLQPPRGFSPTSAGPR